MSTDVVVLAGPTASGKSTLALDLAGRFGGTIVNADAMQVYREMSVLTARPDAAAEARVPHRLYGFLSATEACSAGRWRDLAVGAIRAAQGEGRLPIVVGGTGLYLKALTEGLSPVPPIPEAIRERVRARMREIGPEAFHAVLASRDPEMASRLRSSDRQRLSRAMEVLDATGVSLATWQKQAGGGEGFRFLILVLAPPREVLYAACDARFQAMVAAGALEEVETMRRMNLDPALPATRALGLRELIRHAEGGTTLAQAIGLAQAATRRYAKRQMTWFRNQLGESAIRIEQYSETVRQEIFAKIEQWQLTRLSPGV